jgi:hypothetical protein
MGPIFGWIELIFFYGIAIGFGIWQYVSVSRTLEKTRAERRAREAAEAENAANGADAAPASPPRASAPPAASDKAA